MMGSPLGEEVTQQGLVAHRRGSLEHYRGRLLSLLLRTGDSCLVPLRETLEVH